MFRIFVDVFLKRCEVDAEMGSIKSTYRNTVMSLFRMDTHVNIPLNEGLNPHRNPYELYRTHGLS